MSDERQILNSMAQDGLALNTIQSILSGSEWNAETIERIAEIVRSTGRVVDDLA